VKKKKPTFSRGSFGKHFVFSVLDVELGNRTSHLLHVWFASAIGEQNIGFVSVLQKETTGRHYHRNGEWWHQKGDDCCQQP